MFVMGIDINATCDSELNESLHNHGHNLSQTCVNLNLPKECFLPREGDC